MTIAYDCSQQLTGKFHRKLSLFLEKKESKIVKNEIFFKMKSPASLCAYYLTFSVFNVHISYHSMDPPYYYILRSVPINSRYLNIIESAVFQLPWHSGWSFPTIEPNSVKFNYTRFRF